MVVISWGVFVVVSSGKDAAQDCENDEEDVEGVPAGLDGGRAYEARGGGEERRQSEEEDGENDDGEENDYEWRAE